MRKKLYLTIEFTIAFTIIFVLIGSFTYHWSSYPRYLLYFFTYQSTLISFLFYTIILINYDHKYSNLNFIHKESIKTGFLTYTLLVFCTVVFFFFPLEISQLFGVGPGAIPENLSPPDSILICEFIDNILVHLLIPILILIDLVTTPKKVKYSHNHFLILLPYLIFYLIIVFLIGGYRDVYPYTVLDFSQFQNYYLFYLSIFYIFLLFILAFFLARKNFKKILTKINIDIIDCQ